MIKQTYLLPLALLFCQSVFAQTKDELRPLVPGQPVEREIAGGESHTYQISLSAGQFMRVVVEQKGIDLTLVLAPPDGKQVIAVSLTRPGGIESLSAEAAADGDYRLTLRALSPGHITGAYLLQMEVRVPSTEDGQRITAERMLIEANSMVSQGNTAQRAIVQLDKALTIWRAIGDRYWEANTLNLLGRAHHSIKLDEKAIEYAEQGLILHRQVKNRAGQASALNTIGTSYDVLGKFEKAIEYREQALAAARDVKDRGAEGIILSNLALENGRLGRPEKTIEYAEQSLPILRETNNRSLEARALNQLGFANEALGRPETSIECYERALAITREIKDREGEIDSLRFLAVIYARQGSSGKAREYAEQALALAREAKSPALEGRALDAIAQTYHYVGQYEKAIEYYEQSLAIARELKNRREELVNLANIGNDLIFLDRNEKALEYFESALIIAREMNLRHREGEILVVIGKAHVGLNDEKAREYLEQALTITREVKDRHWEVDALAALAESHYRSHRYGKAKEYGVEGLAASRATGFRAAQVTTLSILAMVERNQGNLARARSLIEEAAQIAESDRLQTLLQESRSALFAKWRYVHDIEVDVLMHLHKADPAGGFDALAVEASERTRARSLLEMLKEAGADIRRGVDPDLLDRERTLASRLNAKAAVRTQLLSRPQTSEQAAVLAREISQIDHDYEGVQAEIRRTSPRYAALTQPQPLKLKEIQQQLDPATLLLEYSLGEERSYLWAITKDSLTSYELPKSELIEKTARQVYELLTARSTNKRGETAPQRQERISQAETKQPAAARGLSQTILAPVAAQLGNKRLVIVADGALQYIPFAMLPEPSVVSSPLSVAKNHKPRTTDHGPPLIVNHEVISLPSASALAIQRSELAGRQLAPKMLAVIADPVFDRKDARFTTAGIANTETAPSPSIAFNDARSIEHLAENSADKSGVATLKMVIPRLPFTRQEATRLLALTPKNSSFSAIDFQANRDTVLSPELSQYRYVHFATHGLLDSERPGLSALVLSMVDAQGKPQDGFLRANDIYNLKLPAELVVLSACQTGLGKEIKGEGLVGLTRGFMYAGAARVVVSLWNVNDKATADLMTKFYEKMLKQGQRPAAALRAAQVEMWKQKQWQSPYYWAAFTLQGEWR
jgi:CHAT domain-containing protein/Tfp pilus assembly protein PilF